MSLVALTKWVLHFLQEQWRHWIQWIAVSRPFGTHNGKSLSSSVSILYRRGKTIYRTFRASYSHCGSIVNLLQVQFAVSGKGQSDNFSFILITIICALIRCERHRITISDIGKYRYDGKELQEYFLNVVRVAQQCDWKDKRCDILIRQFFHLSYFPFLRKMLIEDSEILPSNISSCVIFLHLID